MVEFEDVDDAYRRIRTQVHRTPVLRSRYFDRLLDAELFFKCENFQRSGAFKFRGACNAVLALDADAAARGVVTHSSGNHGAALALAAQLNGIPAHIVLPGNAVGVKRQTVLDYGAQVIECGSSLADRQATATAVVKRTGGSLVHPFDDARVIAGQGTVGMEILEQVQDLELLIAPVGGGGLLSGISVAVAGRAPRVALMGAEPVQADDAKRSLEQGVRVGANDPQTIADGLRADVGALTFPILQRYVERIVSASEAGIAAAMRLVWERMKIVIEPSAAVPLAALLEHPHIARGKRVAVVFSGGNVDLAQLPWACGRMPGA